MLRRLGLTLLFAACAIGPAGRGSTPGSARPVDLAVLREVQLGTRYVGDGPTLVVRQYQDGAAAALVAYREIDDPRTDSLMRRVTGDRFGCHDWERSVVLGEPAWICTPSLRGTAEWREYLHEIDTFLARDRPQGEPTPPAGPAHDSTGRQLIRGRFCSDGMHWQIVSGRGDDRIVRTSLAGTGPNCWADTPAAIAYNTTGMELIDRGFTRIATSSGTPAGSVQQ